MKVIILRFRVRGASDRKASPLFRRQLDLDFVGDGACNLALQTQNIANAAIVFLSPQLALTESLRQVTVIRTRSPERTTVRSSTASTFSSPAISRSDFLLALYCITDWREITRGC